MTPSYLQTCFLNRCKHSVEFPIVCPLVEGIESLLLRIRNLHELSFLDSRVDSKSLETEIQGLHNPESKVSTQSM